MKKQHINVGLVALLVVFSFLAWHYFRESKELRHRLDRSQVEWENYLKEEQARRDTLDAWRVLQMAIVMTESEFNPKAVGQDGDWGLFQITDVYSREVNRILKSTTYTHEDAFDIQKSVEMFGIVQEYYNPTKDVEKAIRYHNKASWYRKKVQNNILFIERMEKVRSILQENSERTYL